MVSVIGFALLLWGLNFLKGRDIFKKKITIYAVYKHVNGLSEANAVLINGFKIGQVKKISFVNDTTNRLLIEMIIESNISIPKGSVARIYSADLMGSKAIEIVPSHDRKYITDGDTLKSDIQTTLQEEVNKQVLPLKRKAETLILSIDSLISTVQLVLNKNTRNNLEKSFESIHHAIKNLENITFRVDTLFSSEQGRIKRILQNVESITFNLKNNNDKIKKIIENFSVISDSLSKVDFVNTIKGAEKTLNQFSEIATKINKGEGSLGALINNDTLYNNLESSSKELNELIRDIKLNPHRYIRISVIGRNPKKDLYQQQNTPKKSN